MNEPFLLTKEQAVIRYSISIRTLEMLYRRHRDFPVLHIGRKVLIQREAADRWFTEWLGGTVDA